MNFNFASRPRPQPMEIDQIAQYEGGGKWKGKGRDSKANIRRVKMAKENNQKGKQTIRKQGKGRECTKVRGW